MSTPFWAIPAARSLRQTDALLASGVLQWFDGLCGRHDDAPAERLERLIRQAMGAAAPAPAAAAAASSRPASRVLSRVEAAGPAAADALPAVAVAPPAGPGLPLTRHQRMRLAQVSGIAAGGQPATPDRPQPFLPVAAPATVRAATVRAADAVAAAALTDAADDGTTPPAAGRRTVAAAPDGAPAPAAILMPPATSLAAAAGPAAHPPPASAAGARSAQVLDWSAVQPAAMRRHVDAARARPGVERAALSALLPADPDLASARQSALPSALAASPASPSRSTGRPDSAGADRPGLTADSAPGAALPTRLVSGLPALQGLLHAALVDSRQRHLSTPGTASAASMAGTLPLPEAPALLAAPTGPKPLPPALIGGLPVLDALGEEMLVDRLADRLQERLREQALREFGFTGGWV